MTKLKEVKKKKFKSFILILLHIDIDRFVRTACNGYANSLKPKLSISLTNKPIKSFYDSNLLID